MVFFKGSGPMIGMDKNVIRITAPEGVDKEQIEWEVQREMEHAQKEMQMAQQEMEIAQEEMERAQKEMKEIRIEVRDAGEGKEGNDKVVRKEVIVEVPDAPATPDAR
jgi:predicted metal-dependent hydrolase